MDTAEKLSTTEVKVIELRAEFVSDYFDIRKSQMLLGQAERNTHKSPIQVTRVNCI